MPGADKSKLNNIEDGATADQTDAEIQSAVQRTDGSGSGLNADLLDDSHASTFEARAEKGAASGYAPLDSASRIPSAHIPPVAITERFVVNSQSAQLALSAQEGDVAIRTDQSRTYIRNSGTAGTMADWTELATPPDAIQSVDGRTGTVSLADRYAPASHVGSRTDHPAATSTQDGRMVATDKAKLDTLGNGSSYLTSATTPTYSGDLNALAGQGFYRIDRTDAAVVNAPPNSADQHAWIYLTQLEHTSSGYHFQRSVDYNGARIYERTQVNGTWSAWQQIGKVPNGGDTTKMLSKASATDQDLIWRNFAGYGAFSIYRSGANYNVPHSTITTCLWDTADFNYESVVVFGNNGVTAKVSGIWYISGQVLISPSTQVSGKGYQVRIYKNGSPVGHTGYNSGDGTQNIGFNTDGIFKTNAGDTFDLRVFHNAGQDALINTATNWTYFMGFLLRDL